jgi:hypothetical protein
MSNIEKYSKIREDFSGLKCIALPPLAYFYGLFLLISGKAT